MKRRNVVTLRHALQRGVQNLATDPGPPLSFYAAGDTVVKTEPADGGSGIPRSAIRRCRMKGVQLERNKPLQAPETAGRNGGRCAARLGLRRLWRPSSNVHPRPPGFAHKIAFAHKSGDLHIKPILRIICVQILQCLRTFIPPPISYTGRAFTCPLAGSPWVRVPSQSA